MWHNPPLTIQILQGPKILNFAAFFCFLLTFCWCIWSVTSGTDCLLRPINKHFIHRFFNLCMCSASSAKALHFSKAIHHQPKTCKQTAQEEDESHSTVLSSATSHHQLSHLLPGTYRYGFHCPEHVPNCTEHTAAWQRASWPQYLLVTFLLHWVCSDAGSSFWCLHLSNNSDSFMIFTFFDILHRTDVVTKASLVN